MVQGCEPQLGFYRRNVESSGSMKSSQLDNLQHLTVTFVLPIPMIYTDVSLAFKLLILYIIVWIHPEAVTLFLSSICLIYLSECL